MKADFDLIVVGGGINGTGIAADACGRNLSCCLIEQQDLACATSSYSSKLLHGGLRYLEQYEFKLVKKALEEREVLLRNAKHLVSPLRFQIPHQKNMRPAWMIKAGLFLYDNLVSRDLLPKSKQVHYSMHNSPLKPHIRIGFEYSDCLVDDSRLVIANALRIKEKKGQVLTRTQCYQAKRDRGLWKVNLLNLQTGEKYEIHSKALVNATGPWVDKVNTQILGKTCHNKVRLIKGSHLVVPKFYSQDNAFIMQHGDKRVVFVIPYLKNYCLIGTTDIEHQGDPNQIVVENKEIKYLLDLTNSYFSKVLQKKDICWHYSGVRPLIDDGKSASKVSRDYQLDLEDELGNTPLLTVYGGKLTTYRLLAQASLAKLKPYLPQMGPKWTADEPLPGANINLKMEDFVKELTQKYPQIPITMLKRFATTYGSRTHNLLADKVQTNQLGKHFGADLYQEEVDYLINHEWVLQANDILWRRTKLGLKLSSSEQMSLNSYLNQAAIKNKVNN